MARFRMGTLNHVHIHVPDREAAAAWYAEHLGFEPVDDYAFWAEDVEGGPLQISADGGRTMLALFQTWPGQVASRQEAGVAFSVDAPTFVAFTRSLADADLRAPTGEPLGPEHLVDYDLCFAFDLADPWGNVYELNCFDHAAVQRDLVDGDGLTPGRRWSEDVRPRPR